MPQPNILLIILDTLRRDRLSAYGHDRATSPALDAFAADSALYERAVAPAQWTIPAHASLFTGVYPSRHGVTQGNSALDGSLPTLAEILRVGGYHTIAFCNNPLVGVLNNGLQRGFDAFYNYASAIPNRPQHAQERTLRREFERRFRPTARRLGNLFAQNDELFRIALHPRLVPFWSKWIRFKGSTRESLDDLMAYWDAHHAGGADRPLFAFVNLMGAHLPYWSPRDLLEQIAPEYKQGNKAAFQFMRRFNAEGARWACPPETPYEDWQRQTLLDFYDAEIKAQDAELGRLLAHLKARGALDDTLIVIAADHGETHGEHDLFGHGFNVHQELVHVPMVMHAPDRLKPGTRVRDHISTRRLFHTLLDAAGIQPPLADDDPNADIARLSLLDGAREVPLSEAVPSTSALHLLEHAQSPLLERLHLRAVRRAVYEGDYKLIWRGDVKGGVVEGLYHIASDPAETHNLAIAQPERAAALAAHLSDVTASTNTNTAANHHDAAILENLRALGYIE